MKSHLDPAFLRRLRFLVDIPAPDAAVRREIWRRVFPPAAPTEQLDLDVLARMDITGGNIKNIAVNAAFLAAEAGSPIRMEHVLHAARREYDKLDKMALGAEFGPQAARGIR
jgi:ATP-dependent 26S proteasome regulatory subunit